MEFLAGLSVLLALGVVGGGAYLVLRRRQTVSKGRRSAELAALDERISERIAMLREGHEVGELPERTPVGIPDDATAPMPALVPVDRGSSWTRLFGFGRDSDEPRSRRVAVRDAAIVIGIAVVFLLGATQLLPAANGPEETPTPAPTFVAVLPSGTADVLLPTPAFTFGAQMPTVTPDITYEATPTPIPTPTPTGFVAPTPTPGGGGGGGGGGGATPTPFHDTTPPSRPGGFGVNTLTPISVLLDWTASSDNIGVVGYRLYRDGVLRTTTAGLSFSDTGLTPGTSYTYGIRAYDAAGNVSTEAIQPVTTPAATPTPCTVTAITIAPNPATVTAGSPQAYTATTNCGTDVTSNTSFSMSTDGACAGATCTPTTASATAQVVTGTDGAMQDTASLTVNHAAATSVVIAPTSSTITLGQSQTYSLTAHDTYGNTWDVTSSSTFTMSTDGGCGSSTCTPATGGGATQTVTGDFTGLQDTAQLTVN